MTNLIDTRPTGPAAPLPPPRPTGRPPKRTPFAVRVLWKVFAAIFVAGALVWGPYQVITVLAHEERVETSSYPAAGLTRLVVDGTAGSVRVEGTDGDTIEVRADISDGLRKTGESQRVVGNVLELRSTCPNFGSDWCSVDYDISVPRGIELVIDGDDGTVAVAGTTGPVDIDNANGSVELTDVSGPVQMTSDNGHIEGRRLTSPTVTAHSDNGRVVLEFLAAPTTVVATADNGRVEVVVPDDGEAYLLQITTDNGNRTEDIPVDSASARTITIHTDNGSATARTAP